MTTQENIAKHLGVNLNEPFIIDGWEHKPLHIDPNLGLVTQDGNRVSNALMQEIFFGNVHITKLDKRRFYIAPLVPKIDNCFIKDELARLCVSLEDIDKNHTYDNEIMARADILANKYCHDVKHIHEFEKYLDECLAQTTRFEDGINDLADFFNIGLSYAIEQIICAHLDVICYNVLAKYVSNIGLDTVLEADSIEAKIAQIAESCDWAETSQEWIDMLIKEVS